MNARDELMELAYRSMYPVAADVARIQPLAERAGWEIEMHGRAADAVLAAGYRKPRTITTIGDLSGMPAGTVISTAHGRVFEYTSRNWLAPGFPNDYQPIIDWLPATVLHEPEAAA